MEYLRRQRYGYTEYLTACGQRAKTFELPPKNDNNRRAYAYLPKQARHQSRGTERLFYTD